MKKIAYYSAILFCLLFSLLHAGLRDAEWKKVQGFIKKSRPKSAAEQLTSIVKLAMKDQQWAEASKALCMKINQESRIQGSRPEENIKRVEAELTNLPKPMVGMMETYLAHSYWQYFRQNKYRFMQRTRGGQAPGDDITTWDLARVIQEIGVHFDKALKDEKTLQAISIDDWKDLLHKGDLPLKFRPTLYDFIAHEALKFYSSGEHAATKVQGMTEIEANSPALASPEVFMKWKVENDHNEDLLAKGLKLYQKILAFHQNGNDKSAFIDADLWRLDYVYQHAIASEDKVDLYIQSLERFTKRWSKHRIVARAYYKHANILYEKKKDYVAAHRLASQGAKLFPNTPGGNQCHNLILKIKAKSLSVMTENVWNNPLPALRLNYRNIDQVHFKIAKYDWGDTLKHRNRNYLNQQEKNKILNLKSIKSWSEKLPETKDYKSRQEEFQVPKDLAPGFYVVLSSVREDFGKNNNQISFAFFWVSDLSIVMRTSSEGSGGFVLNAESGEPLEGAQVKVYYQDKYNQPYKLRDTLKTNADGLFKTKVTNKNCYFMASYRGHRVATQTYWLSSGQQKYQTRQRSVLFTDRGLYRPGQFIQVKGICIEYHHGNNEYKTLANQVVELRFLDANHKEIATQKLETNAFGSFFGQFTAPRDRLMGQMTVQVVSGPSGSASVTVEEYKRPKFRVTLKAPEKMSKLESKVEMTGQAKGLNGAAVDYATVKYRIVRKARFPVWGWRSYRYPSRSEVQEIAYGTLQTDAQGNFKFDFMAKADRSVAKKSSPIYTFSIEVNVTDSAGETRASTKSIQLGYAALKASLGAKQWQDVSAPVEVTVNTKTLSGVPQAAAGELKFYRLKEPKKIQRKKLSARNQSYEYRRHQRLSTTISKDLSNPRHWEMGDLVKTHQLDIDGTGVAKVKQKLEAGVYRVLFETQDSYKEPVRTEHTLQVLDPSSQNMAIKIPFLVAAPHWTVQPGEKFMALWGTGYDKGRAYIEIEHRQKTVHSYWSQSGITQTQIEKKITESLRGGFTLHVWMMRENRMYSHSQKISVPWNNKKLDVKWEHMTSKLEPGAEQTWTAVITDPNAEKVTSEMVATLYDNSLDEIKTFNWKNASFSWAFYQDHARIRMASMNKMSVFNNIYHHWPSPYKSVSLNYDRFPSRLIPRYYRRPNSPRKEYFKGALASANGNGVEGESRNRAMDKDPAKLRRESYPKNLQEAKPNLEQVSIRKNLQETAFFFPKLISNKKGIVRMEFKMPEALTEWKFMGFAHDTSLRSAFLEDTAVTRKDIMVAPNAPRFLREGDELEFSVKVQNQSPTRQKGTVRFTLSDARTLENVDRIYDIQASDKTFDIPAKESRSYFWRIKVPDGARVLIYKAIASTSKLSDGEEGYIPVLSKRILVTESLPLPIRGVKDKTFSFKKLLDSAQSTSLKHESVTVQMVSNPSWYAVMALPYLMETPHENSEAVFNRLYANSLAAHIANSDPKIRRVFDLWKGTDALDSNLEKNEDLKSILLEETPWVVQSDNEREARQRIGTLFDSHRLKTERKALMKKLESLKVDSAWPWQPKGRVSEYISLYIATGFARLRHLGVRDIDMKMAIETLPRLERWINERYRKIKHKELNHLSSSIAMYLYCRSFYLDDRPIDKTHKVAFDYYLGQAKKYWPELRARQSQAHLALALLRVGKDKTTPVEIMTSLHEHSVTDDELGRFWRDTELAWSWNRAPIETQALMIEAFDEVAKNADVVEECKVWMLKQKQTQDWKTTKATADAIYALLLRGTDVLASNKLVEVTLAGKTIQPQKIEAGTGFYQERFSRGEIKAEMGNIKLSKKDEGVAWGSLHWQYLEDIDQITPHDATPLLLSKKLFIKKNSDDGPTLVEIDKNHKLKVGDRLISRIVLKSDRDMEYLHLKDQRGSGTEVVNQTSSYQYQDGLYYYASPRDTASHFYIDYLAKGTYVFEYETTVFHSGTYQSGIANIQCLYAPEFNAHSQSFKMDVGAAKEFSKL